MRVISVIILLLLCIASRAQIPVGSWRLHLPNSKAIHVAYTPARVYCTTGESLFAYKLNDNSVEELSKITGLSDYGVSALGYSQELNLVVIGYSNGNIDIVKGRDIINISDLKKKSLPASKSINHIFFDEKNAYLSCSFGIILLDLEKNEIKDTYIFGANGSFIRVNSCVVAGNEILAATVSGIYKAGKDDPMLVDYSRWNRIREIPNYSGSFLQVTNFEDVVYAVYSSPDAGHDSIYYRRDNIWRAFPIEDNTDIYHIGFSEDHIFVSTSINLKVFDTNYHLKQTLWQYPEIGVAQPRETYLDPKQNLWIADFGNGLIEQKANGRFEQILPNGPASSRIKSFHYAGGRLYATAGGTDISFNNLYNPAEYFVFESDEWKSFANPGIFDYMTVKTDPVDKELSWISTWGSGIFTYKNGLIVNHYDETNSTLQNAVAGGPFTRVWGMDFDRDNNLWVSNSFVNNSLSVVKRDGTWKGYPLKNVLNAEILGDVVVDDQYNIWVVLLKGSGIMVLNTNNTPDNPDDDRLIRFKPKNAYGQIISNVYTLVKDLEGKIWAGTDFGPVIYADPNDVFEGKTDGYQPTLPRPGSDQADPLLGSEIVRAIAVDGANRKWIGTERGGAFLVSAEGDSSLLQFNTDNSPVLSNTILGIGIQDKTGEVFFGTDRGIISYRSDATAANEDFGDVYAFPNPVRPDYHGNITITGLIRDANVKITDITGNLVFETTTLGGQVVWDGNNFDGRRVASGIYIIFCTNEDGSKIFVTKLLFMN